MANLLLDPNIWMDNWSISPPPWWDGEAYAWDASQENYFDMTLVDLFEPMPGDTLECVASYDKQGGDPSARYLNWVERIDGEYVVRHSFEMGGASGSVAVFVESPGPRGTFVVAAYPDQRFSTQYYEGTMRLGFASPPQEISYNCECDDDYPRTTLAEMRKRLLRRLGFAVQANNPPPGMADLLDDFIHNAQEMLFRRYSVFRRERFYTWELIPGTRFYDLDANADACTKQLDPRMISWAGISQGDDSWRPLYCGIDPVMYTSRGPGIPSHYEIRQCIELWPAPVDATWKLRIKGQFGLMPLEADGDYTTVEPEAIFLLALANAKAHYGQADAGNYASQLTAYMRDLIRGSHHTRRYIPGTADPRNAVRPILVGGWPEDQR